MWMEVVTGGRHVLLPEAYLILRVFLRIFAFVTFTFKVFSNSATTIIMGLGFWSPH